MRIAYFDCFSGISGDMCLGALISAGVDFDRLKEELTKLPVEGYALRWEKVKRNGITSANFFVDMLDVEQPERRLADIHGIIDRSELPEEVKEKSKAVFNRLAVAEAAVHDTTPDHIHFHEVGAVDAIVDIVGTVLGLHLLGVRKVYASPLPMGRGFIKCMHGIIPSPAPATLEVLQGIPIYGTGIEGELVTPTGAALISTLAESFTSLPPLTVSKIGYGAGKKMMAHPNLLRLILGEMAEGSLTRPGHGHTGHHHPHHHHNHEHHPHDHGDEHCHMHPITPGQCMSTPDHQHSQLSHTHLHEHGHAHLRGGEGIGVKNMNMNTGMTMTMSMTTDSKHILNKKIIAARPVARVIRSGRLVTISIKPAMFNTGLTTNHYNL